MPFRKIQRGKDKGKFRSPSGRVMTLEQVRAYYSKRGFQTNSNSLTKNK